MLDIFALVSRMVRRVAEEWGFEVAEAPDGLRIRSGLASRVAETIPYGRVQAVRMLEPLLWRRFGWCRLELHIAGSVGHERNQPRAAIRRALLPVGDRSQTEWLLGRVVAEHEVSLTPPPRTGGRESTAQLSLPCRWSESVVRGFRQRAGAAAD